MRDIYLNYTGQWYIMRTDKAQGYVHVRVSDGWFERQMTALPHVGVRGLQEAWKNAYIAGWNIESLLWWYESHKRPGQRSAGEVREEMLAEGEQGWSDQRGIWKRMVAVDAMSMKYEDKRVITRPLGLIKPYAWNHGGGFTAPGLQ